ncbi:MAG: Hpt domain-containing protein, partial [Desulfovibrionaceae bacterium]
MHDVDLVDGFVEDCREHLDSIEQRLMDIEAAGAGADPDLVNEVFRAAHSIKGGAGMLGFDAIKTLAHKLENVLHLLRSRELVPDPAVMDGLLRGFDRLGELVGRIDESESMPIDEHVDRLVALVQGVEAARGGAAAGPATERIPLPGSGIFEVDAVSLRQAMRGGNNIYLLEFDMLHDFERKQRSPMQAMRSLEDGGRVLDCKVDLDAVGTLDGDFLNRLPMYMLYATILEMDMVPALVRIDAERITPLDQARAAGTVQVQDPAEEAFGPCVLHRGPGAWRIVLPEEAGTADLPELRRALLA